MEAIIGATVSGYLTCGAYDSYHFYFSYNLQTHCKSYFSLLAASLYVNNYAMLNSDMKSVVIHLRPFTLAKVSESKSKLYAQIEKTSDSTEVVYLCNGPVTLHTKGIKTLNLLALCWGSLL